MSEADKADIDRAKALRLMGANASLIKRPVVEHAGGVLVGFDAGAWRRDAGAAATAFQQVFAPQFNQGGNLGAGIDRTMFALTAKNGHTRIYLTEGTANTGGST